MLDLTHQLQDLGEHLNAVHPTPDPETIILNAELSRHIQADGEVSQPTPTRSVPPGQLEPLPVRTRRRRWSVAAAAAVIVVVLIAVAAMLTRSFIEEPDVTETTTAPAPTTIAGVDGESVFGFPLADVPPFRATVVYDRNPEGVENGGLGDPGVPQGATAVMEMSYAAPDRFRREMLAMDPVGPGQEGNSPGSYRVSNSGVTVYYLAYLDKLSESQAPFSPLEALFWNSDWPNWDRQCARWDYEFLPDETIAGRNALHLACSDLVGDWEFWVDAETGVVLKVVGAVVGNPLAPGTSPGGGFEVTSIEYDPVFAEGLFTTPGPAPQAARISQVPALHATVKSTLIAEQVNMAYDDLNISGDPFVTQELWFAGTEGWRAHFVDTDLPADVPWSVNAGNYPGDFVVWTGSETVQYFGSTNRYSRNPDGYRAPEELLWLMAPPSPDWLSRSCGGPSDDTFLERSAQRFSCTDGLEQIEAWIDEATGIVLRWSITGGPVMVDLAERPPIDFELLSLEVAPTFKADTFEFTPPPDAVDVVADIPFDKWSQFGFDRGDVVPTWTGPLVTGNGEIALEDLRGRPAMILLWAWWDENGLTAIRDFATLADQWSNDISFLSVGIMSDPDPIRNVVDRGGFTFPTVACFSDSGNGCSPDDVYELWKFYAWVPVGWVLLDEDGRAVDVFVAETVDFEGQPRTVKWPDLDEISAAIAAVSGP